MRNFMAKPYNWLLLPVIITLLYRPFHHGGMDILAGNEMVHLTPLTFHTLLLGPLVLLWLLYIVTNKQLHAPKLTLVSVIMALVTFVLIVAFIFYFKSNLVQTDLFIDISNAKNITYAAMFMEQIGVLPVAAYLLWLVNLIMGVMKKNTTA